MPSCKTSLLLAFITVPFAGCEVLFPLQPKKTRSQATVVRGSAAAAAPAVSVRNGTEIKHPGEADYLKKRRLSSGTDGAEPYLGVALSGGGIRSATISMGVLQGLEDSGLLKNVDYLSCVSGGGYAGAWYVSHLKSETEKSSMRLKEGFTEKALAEQFSSSRTELLNIGSCSESPAFKHIRDRGSLSGGGAAGNGKAAWAVARLLLTMGPNLVQDLGLHLQPSPGKWNYFRPFYSYRNFLEEYYTAGWRDNPSHPHALLETDVNRPGSETPFFISCASLANSEGPLFGEDKNRRTADGKPADKWANHHFEMTPLWCGSPLTGWIPTAYFDRSISDVKGEEDSRTAELLRGPIVGRTTPPFRLSSAVAVSGAAVDSRGINKKLRIFYNTLLTAVNANLRYQTGNFNQDLTEVWNRPQDRLREATTDRFIRSPRSNVLQLSDGGHFENLGVYALLRRGVPKILSFDAGMDKKYVYHDLENLLQLCLDNGWKVTSVYPSKGEVRYNANRKAVLPGHFAGAKNQPPANPLWHFQVTNNKKMTSQVYYIKSSFIRNGPAPALNPYHPLALREPVLGAMNPDQPGGDGEEAKRPDYPHIHTFTLAGWNHRRFDSYRDLGRLMGRVAAQAAKMGPGKP